MPPVLLCSKNRELITIFFEELYKQYELPQLFVVGNISTVKKHFLNESSAYFIFVDQDLIEDEGLGTLHMLQYYSADSERIVMVNEEDPALIFKYVKEGATGYLQKEDFRQQFPSLLTHLSKKEALMSPEVARYFIERLKFDFKPENKEAKVLVVN